MEITTNVYLVSIAGICIRITRKRFLMTNNEIELPLSLQYSANFIYDVNNKRILKNRYSYNLDLTSIILNNCLNSSIDYLDFFDEYDIQSLSNLAVFLRECLQKRIVVND